MTYYDIILGRNKHNYMMMGGGDSLRLKSQI